MENTSQDPNAPRPAWTVTRVEDGMDFTPAKGYAKVRRVHFQLANGHESMVTLPATGYSVQKAQIAIEAAAEELYNLLALQGPLMMPGG